MKHFFSLFLMILSLGLYAQQDTKSCVFVSDIVINGNNVTQEDIILRELTFEIGDTIPSQQWEEALRISYENVQNTTLFNFVTIEQYEDNSQENAVIVSIEVVERWYLWVFPYVSYSDRNLNAWYEADDIRRFSYGIEMKYRNFLGRKNNLDFTFISGYNQNYGLLYDIPYIMGKRNLGLKFGGGYKRDKEVAYITENNKIIYFNGDDKFAKQSACVFVEPYFRFGHRNKLFLNFSYNDALFHEKLPFLNGDFCCLEGNRFQYFSLLATFKNDFRDEQNYPLDGHYFELMMEKIGFGAFVTSPDVFYAKITTDWYQPIKGRWYWASNLTMKMSANQDIPYFLNQGLGYKNDYVRTYELYVIDAMNFALIKNNLKYAILNPVTRYIPFVKNERFGKIHFALYANVFFDCAYSWKMPENTTSFLDNKFIFGTGIGLDFVTYYDKVLRLEYGINDMGETGLFVHFVAPI